MKTLGFSLHLLLSLTLTKAPYRKKAVNLRKDNQSEGLYKNWA